MSLTSLQVVEVSTEGEVLRQFGVSLPALQLGWTPHVAVDSQGHVFVADYDNQRILLLNAQLALRRVIVDERQLTYKRPRRLCYMEQSGQLLVAIFGGVAVFDALC